MQGSQQISDVGITLGTAIWSSVFRTRSRLLHVWANSDFCHIFERPIASGVVLVLYFTSCIDSSNTWHESDHLILMSTLLKWVQLLSPSFWCGNWGTKRFSNLATVIRLVQEPSRIPQSLALDHSVTLPLGKPIYLGFKTIKYFVYFLWRWQ